MNLIKRIGKIQLQMSHFEAFAWSFFIGWPLVIIAVWLILELTEIVNR